MRVHYKIVIAAIHLHKQRFSRERRRDRRKFMPVLPADPNPIRRGKHTSSQPGAGGTDCCELRRPEENRQDGRAERSGSEPAGGPVALCRGRGGPVGRATGDSAPWSDRRMVRAGSRGAPALCPCRWERLASRPQMDQPVRVCLHLRSVHTLS